MAERPPARRFCDVALPVPLDRLFTYELPEALQRRVQPGARVVAPFGPRKLTGIAVALHGSPPDREVRQILRLIDEGAALSPELLELGRWVSQYYCAPIGETLKAMLPLGGELRTRRLAALTALGVQAASRFTGGDDPYGAVLRALEKRPLIKSYLEKKVPGSANALKALERKGLVSIHDEIEGRDPLRARDGRLVVKPANLDAAPARMSKGERWLVDFLRRHPASHDVEPLALERKDAAAVARKLARRGVVELAVVREVTALRAEGREVELSLAQKAACDAIAASIESGGYGAHLLHGVTGSGKTEVYLRSIEKALAAGKSALLMVPEIGLTPAVASQFFARLGDRVALLHSAFTGWQRSEQWRRIRSGEARVAIGTRSSVFAPLENLGLVIVDEEHESSYKQEETPRYHGRDVAVVRARSAGATIVLGSATPSLESRQNAEKGKYALLELPGRVLERPMAEVEVVDMRLEFLETRRNDLFSRRLIGEIEAKLASGEQAMVLLNRRGFAMFVMCRKCGERIECQNCSVTLTYHRRNRRLLCHYCDYAEPVPEKCPACGSEYVHFQGSGSEKVEDALREKFPRARIARLDRDTVKGREHYESILRGFREGSYDILAGTQMIAKGHDIPNVTLVGVVSTDVGLGVPDFRAAERTFQLLTQVAGRAGRGHLPGKVLLQTMNPEHYAVRFAAQQDYAGFYQKETNFRRMMHYPPFVAMASILIRSQKLEQALAWSGKLARALQDGLPPSLRLLGPAAAPVAKLKTEYRYQFLIKASSRPALAALLRRARSFAEAEGWPAAALVIDVDPTSFS